MFELRQLQMPIMLVSPRLEEIPVITDQLTCDLLLTTYTFLGSLFPSRVVAVY